MSSIPAIPGDINQVLAIIAVGRINGKFNNKPEDILGAAADRVSIVSKVALSPQVVKVLTPKSLASKNDYFSLIS
jgi:hypothetical protein